MAPTDHADTWSDRVVDLGLRGLISGARLLPYRQRVAAFGAVTARVVAPLTRLGPRIGQNLSHVYPTMAEDDRRRLARRIADSIGRQFIEAYCPHDLARRMAQVTPTGPGVAALAAARADGRPVLLMSAHFGNYVAARACLLARGYAIDGFIRPMANPFVNAHYVATMEALGGRALLQGPGGVKALISRLRKGGMVMMLNDLYVGSGVELPFLGRPARTSTAPAEIAARTGATIIPFFGTRLEDGLGFSVDLDAPLPQGDPLETTRAYNAAVEARVRAHPEQWFWVHRRWKTGKGSGAAPT